MLLIILFWVVLAFGTIGLIGAIAENGGRTTWATFSLFALALVAAVLNEASWL